MIQVRVHHRPQAGCRQIHLTSEGEVRVEPAGDRWSGRARGLGAMAILVLVALSAWFYGQPAGDPALASAIQSEKREAFAATQAFVAAEVRSGNLLRFPPFSPDNVEWLGAGRFAIYSFVDVVPERDAGSRERLHYSCVLARTPEGRFCLESLALEGAEVEAPPGR